MLKGKLVSLRLLSDSNEDLDYYYSASCDLKCMENTSDKFMKLAKSRIEEGVIENLNCTDSTDYVFCVLLNKVRVGIVYILMDVEKRTAEIQVLIGEGKYRNIGLGFDALFTATKFAHEELNLHSITYKIASHNESMLKGFKVSHATYKKFCCNNGQIKYTEDNLYNPDILARKSFVSNGKSGDFYCYTFILDDDKFPFDDFLKLSSGRFNKNKDEEGRLWNK